jgi:hypothetical protein
LGGAVAGERIVAVAQPESAPVQRAMKRAAKTGMLVDLTFGRRVRAVVFMDSGHVVRVAISPETVQARWAELAKETILGLPDPRTRSGSPAPAER